MLRRAFEAARFLTTITIITAITMIAIVTNSISISSCSRSIEVPLGPQGVRSQARRG